MSFDALGEVSNGEAIDIPIAAAIREPTASFAVRNGPGARWAYLAVVVECLWPSSAPMIGKLKPSTTPIDANECRKS